MHWVRAGALEGFVPLVTSLGGSPVELMRAAGLNPAILRLPEAYLPYDRCATLLNLCAAQCRDELFALKMVSNQGLRTIGVLGLFLSFQPTIGEGMEFTKRFIHLHASGVTLQTAELGEWTQLELDFDLPESLGLAQLRLASIGLLYRIVFKLTGGSLRPREVLLRQAEPVSGRDRMEAFFNCPVRFEVDCDAMLVRTAELLASPNNAGQQLQRDLMDHLRSLEAEFPGNLVAQVRQTIDALLPTHECTLQNVSMLLNRHPRILQKQLAERGTQFRQLLDETRMKIAMQHLQYSNVPLTDLALNLGFSELAVFSRAFKRWSGQSPHRWRRSHPGHLAL